VCPTAAAVAAVDSRLDLVFEADPSAGGGFVCSAAGGSADLTYVQERVYQALILMDLLSFDTPLPWTQETLGEWLVEEAEVVGVLFRDDIPFSFCCDPANYLNIVVTNINQPWMSRWINPQAGVGLRDLLVLFVHEARHNQGLPHTCGTNDNTIAELGAWGAQFHVHNWFAYHSDACFLTSPDPWPSYYLEASAWEALWLQDTRFCLEPDPPGSILPVPSCMAAIFSDSFESGDTSAWSETVP
jgi:hypothetical protein